MELKTLDLRAPVNRTQTQERREKILTGNCGCFRLNLVDSAGEERKERVSEGRGRKWWLIGDYFLVLERDREGGLLYNECMILSSI